MLKWSNGKGVARFLIIYKLLGLSPVTIIDGKSVTRLCDLLCLFISLFIGAFICFYTITNQKTFNPSSDIASTGAFLTFIASIVIAMTSMICSFLFRHKLWVMILKLAGIEQKVNSVNSSPERRNVNNFDFHFSLQT